MTLEFDVLPGSSHGIRVLDPIESEQFDVRTPGPVEPRAIDPPEFYFPVDAAAEIRTRRVTVPYLADVFVRDRSGGMIEEITGGQRRLPHGSYLLEITSVPVKTYLRLEAPLTVFSLENEVILDFGAETPLQIGARSFHERPAGTVTTTGSVEDLMTAVSCFGSALKTDSCERSFPTLRGHPPMVQLGDELHVPDQVSPPETGITVEIPPTVGHVFSVAPLAYYLGASVEAGPDPRLHADGESFRLDGGRRFGESVGEYLKHVFFLDCLARTEGYYPVDLYERSALEPHLDVDFQALYERPIAERVATYLSIPLDRVAEFRPAWPQTFDVDPRPENVCALPFAVDDLAVVRTPTTTADSSPDDVVEEIMDFLRSGNDRLPDDDLNVVGLPETDSLNLAWVGPGFPLGATKATVDSFTRRFDRDARSKSELRIVVVVNDPKMIAEDVVADIYGSQSRFEFDTRVEYRLSTDELAELLASDIDFLHFVGHVRRDGFECRDGVLDARELDHSGVDAFLLNACRSHTQGRALVRKGSLGGVVTLSSVLNEPATRVGRTLARLLNNGFTLQNSVSIARDEFVTGTRYTVIGDGSVRLVTTENGVTLLLSVDSADDRYDVEFFAYQGLGYELGAIFRPHVEPATYYHVTPGTVGEFTVSEENLGSILESEVFPVRFDGDLRWSDEIRLRTDPD